MSRNASAGRRWLHLLAAIPTPLIFAVSLIVALLLLWWQGALSAFAGLFANANWTLLVLAAPVYILSLWVLCYRWYVLVRMAHGASSLPRAAEAFLTSVVINYAAPIGLAVPSRAALTKRALGLTAAETGVIALWEIGVDVIVLGAGSLLWLLVADGAMTTVQGELGLTAARLALLGAVLLAVLAAAGAILRARSRWRAKLQAVGSTLLLAPGERPVEATACLSITVVYWLMQGVVLAMIIAALGVGVSFELMLGLISLPILVGMLSPVPGGAAVREGLMYAVAGLSGAPATEILAAAIVYRLALFAAIPVLYAVVRIWLRSAPGEDSPLDPAAGQQSVEARPGTIRPSR
ncbi:MAG: flippase-like domain-containing protein [Chloroflexia bacterium]|nr:flippase-like domain-containing protein [Chloroflexia bacterium]